MVRTDLMKRLINSILFPISYLAHWATWTSFVVALRKFSFHGEHFEWDLFWQNSKWLTLRLRAFKLRVLMENFGKNVCYCLCKEKKIFWTFTTWPVDLYVIYFDKNKPTGETLVSWFVCGKSEAPFFSEGSCSIHLCMLR